MPTLSELVTAIEQRVHDSTDLQTCDFIPHAIDVPAFFVGVPAMPAYRATFGRGRLEIAGWPLWVFVSANITRQGQHDLATYLDWQGEQSIVRALEDEPTLGGLVDDLLVESSRPLGVDEVAGIGYYGAQLSLHVLITNLTG